jgi:uncharacterized protein (TIGR02757 family)
MDSAALKDFLDRKVAEYNRPEFIIKDPIAIPHRFNTKQDIEISGFFAAVFAWGNRTTIINKSNELMALMENSPFEFVVGHRPKDLKPFTTFSHRTFNSTDLLYFLSFLQYHYRRRPSLEDAFTETLSKQTDEPADMQNVLNRFHDYFFSLPDVPKRTRKHISAPWKNSACKRLNMYLRWMVRSDSCGVDFGLWKNLRPMDLICPLDVHVARVARRFGMIEQKQANWPAAMELTRFLRGYDPQDPAKYDFALFALGVLEKY